MIKNIKEKLQDRSIEQYKNEERSALAKRINTAENRIKILMKIMGNDFISNDENLSQLKLELYRYTNDINFKNAKSIVKFPAAIQLKYTILSGTKLSICTSLNTPNEIRKDRNTAALAIPPLH